MKIIPPLTRKDNVTDILHGREIVDPYRWLEEIHDIPVQTWLDTQSEHTQSLLNKLPSRENLREEFEKLFRTESLGFPHPKKGHYFMVKRMANEDLSVLYVQEGLYGKPRVLVDPNKISKGKETLVNLTYYSTSKDGTLITYGLSETANDKSSLRVMNVRTGENLEDQIPADLYPGGCSWSLDNKGFWYTRRKEYVPQGEEKFHKKIYYHTLGTSFSEDKLIFGENLAKEDSAHAVATNDGNYVLVTVHISSEAHRRTEIYLLNLKDPAKGFLPILHNIKSSTQDIYFYAHIHRDFVYIETNFNAPRGKIERVAVGNINKGLSAWTALIPEHVDRIIKSFSITQNRLFVVTLENVHSVLREYFLDGKFKRDIPFPTLGSCSSIVAEPEGEEVFFQFDSFAYPPTIFRIDFNTDEIVLFKQLQVSMDVSTIEAKQVWYNSKDGTKVPMFLVYRKGLKLDGQIPTMLNAYGGFNISLLPAFVKNIIPFIQRGGLYAIANIRGGGEFGEEWHKAGTKNKKQNVFDDFIAAAEWLIARKYTDSRHLAISGSSNGGLLVGAVMTQRPNLFKAVMMSVPVVDMLRYHLFHGGKHWIPDYGSAEDEEMFLYLLGYSPYHNVKNNGHYPATMIITSDQDDRVHPGQAFKMVARLQEANSSDNPILLRIERKAGHGGAADLSRYINKAVDEWSFIFDQLGLK